MFNTSDHFLGKVIDTLFDIIDVYVKYDVMIVVLMNKIYDNWSYL